MKTTSSVFALIVLISGTMFAQVPTQSFGFGLEVGQLSTVQISYTLSNQLQVAAQMGPITAVEENEYLMPKNYGISSKYFLSVGKSSAYIGFSSFVALNRHYKYGVGIPIGMQHFVSQNVAFFGQITTAKTDNNDSLTMFAGFGVTFYLE